MYAYSFVIIYFMTLNMQTYQNKNRIKNRYYSINYNFVHMPFFRRMAFYAFSCHTSEERKQSEKKIKFCV